MNKVKFTKKNGNKSYIEVDHSLLKNKIISLYKDNKPYSLQSFLKNPVSFSVDRVNYQRFNYNDGSFEYREM